MHVTSRLVDGSEVARTQVLVREGAVDPKVVTTLHLPVGLMFGEPGHEDVAVGSFRTTMKELRQIIDLFAFAFE